MKHPGAAADASLVEMLKAHGLRPTRQRTALAELLFVGGNRHVTAEQLHREAREAGARVSLATVYNALNQFAAAGLLREVVVESNRSYFDTNTADHHHMYFEDTGRLEDVALADVAVAALPAPPAGTRIDRVDIVIRLAFGEG